MSQDFIEKNFMHTAYMDFLMNGSNEVSVKHQMKWLK